MILKVGGKKVESFNDVAVSLRYDSLASTFAFVFQFNPENPDHKAICKPIEYQACTIEHDGEILITGTILNVSFNSSAEPGLVTISGYSKTGVLEDCSIPLSCYPLQNNNINLKSIVEKVIKPFGLSLIVDSSVSSEVNKQYVNSTGGDTQSAKAYLSELASQRNILLTHDNLGNLVLTSAKTAQAPVFDFGTETKGLKYNLSTEGQRMHNTVHVHKQQTKKKAGGDADASNPYVKIFRPRVLRQTTTDDLNTNLAAKNAFQDELASIKVTIEVQGWKLPNELIRPNKIVTILNPELFLYKRTTFFVEAVSYRLNETEETALIECVLPEVYNGKTPKNIFE